jgi:hypothetical protein
VIGGGVVAGFRVISVLAVFPLSAAWIVTAVWTVTAAAVAIKDALEAPTWTWALAGTVRELPELESSIVIREVAGPLRLTSQGNVPAPAIDVSAQ